jgi:hypothetical protein
LQLDECRLPNFRNFWGNHQVKQVRGATNSGKVVVHKNNHGAQSNSPYVCRFPQTPCFSLPHGSPSPLFWSGCETPPDLLHWSGRSAVPSSFQLGYAPISAYLYTAAAASLLQRQHLDLKHRKGYQFGLLLANIMKDIHLRLEEEKKTLPPRRFNCCATYATPGESEWVEQCDRFLLLHFTTPDIKLKAEC